MGISTDANISENVSSELAGFITAAESIAADAQTLFGNLTEIQLNWQPSEEIWSVGLCLEHLVKANDEMLAAIEKHVSSSQNKTIFEKLGLGSGYFGHYILKAVQPENKNKTKAPKVFRPVKSRVKTDIVARFVENQQRVTGLMTRSGHLDLNKTIVTSPIAFFITYSLFNAYKIIVTHERRHFRQAQNLMKLADFPK